MCFLNDLSPGGSGTRSALTIASASKRCIPGGLFMASPTQEITTSAAASAPHSKPEFKKPATLPPPNLDFYELVETLPAEEQEVLKQVRTFMETKVAAHHHEILGRGCVSLRNLARAQGAKHRWRWDAGLRLPRRKRVAGRLGCDGDGTLRHVHRDVLRCAQRPGNVFHLLRRIRRAKTEVAAADGPVGKDRLLRAHRTASRFRSIRRPDDNGEA